jgi:ribosomal protein L7/L12
MTIIGYRKGAKSIDAILSVKKHTGRSLLESKQLIESVLKGQAVQLDEDFVLREELSQLNFILK